MGKETFNPIGPWFTAAESLGEYVGIRFGHVPPGKTDPDWIFLKHTDVDGIGGLVHILRQRGVDPGVLPRIKHPSSPGTFSFVQNMPKFLVPKKRIAWAALEGGREPSSAQHPPKAVAWHVFDEATTIQIRHLCRKSGFTVNSFLLKHLTKAIRPDLADQSAIVPWMLPVNIRGKVDLGSDVANHTSYVGVKVRSYETVRDIHRNVYIALGKGEHWANWQSYLMCQPLGMGMRRYLLRTELAIPEWYVGSFSNLGDWDADVKWTASGCAGDWLFAPPVLRCQHLGAGCVTFQNRLSLTIQTHPELTTNPVITRNWIQRWVKEIEIDLVSVMNKTA